MLQVIFLIGNIQVSYLDVKSRPSTYPLHLWANFSQFVVSVWGSSMSFPQMLSSWKGSFHSCYSCEWNYYLPTLPLSKSFSLFLQMILQTSSTIQLIFLVKLSTINIFPRNIHLFLSFQISQSISGSSIYHIHFSSFLGTLGGNLDIESIILTLGLNLLSLRIPLQTSYVKGQIGRDY